MTRRRLLLLVALLGGCAWTNRENRPVWNAFEQHLVPADTGWFVATLPLTVPAGLGSILVDTFVAHPIQVVDDAVDDAGSLWRDGRPDFQEHYYSEVAFLPVRAALTPTWFVFSFVGRSLFDIGSKEDAAQEAEQARQAELGAQEALRAWFVSVAGGNEARYQGSIPSALPETVRTAARQALAQGKALGRLHVYRLARHGRLGDAVGAYDGLRDPDPVVRFDVLEALEGDTRVPQELIQTLRQDPVESVRGLACRRWPDPASQPRR